MSAFHRRVAATALLAVLLLTFTGCGAPERRTATYYTYFDTVTTVTGYGSEKEFAAACAIVEDVLSRYHEACDIYHQYSGKINACTVNLQAGNGPMAPEPELLEVLAFGREIYDRTDGMCNIAMGAVLSLWHDCRETALSGGAPSVPSAEALQAAAEHCNIEDLILDMDAGTVELRDPAMTLDLGAVAKGYAAERAVQALTEAGYSGYALNLGGNVRTTGTKADGEPWVAGIQDPAGDDYLLRVALTDAALVTSGSYQRYYELDGVRYHHIISPETLYPKNDLLSVSILADDSGLADALSTAVFNMPPEHGLNYVNQLEAVEACWVLTDGTIVYSDGFSDYILP